GVPSARRQHDGQEPVGFVRRGPRGSAPVHGHRAGRAVRAQTALPRAPSPLAGQPGKGLRQP
ncbi:hypothetical protein ABTK22_19675, partial [Acinetobacter baumannii]